MYKEIKRTGIIYLDSLKGGYIMPDLRCTVQTCTHNQNYYCNLDSIVVGGNFAKKADETSCDSFEERKGGSAYADAYSDMAGKEASAKSERRL